MLDKIDTQILFSSASIFLMYLITYYVYNIYSHTHKQNINSPKRTNRKFLLLVIPATLTFLIINQLNPFNLIRYFYNLLPILILTVSILLLKIFPKRIKWKYLIFTLLFILSICALDIKNIDYLFIEETTKTELVEKFDNNRDTPTVILLDNNSYYLSNITFILQNRNNIYIVRKEFNKETLSKILKEFNNPKEIYVIIQEGKEFIGVFKDINSKINAETNEQKKEDEAIYVSLLNDEFKYYDRESFKNEIDGVNIRKRSIYHFYNNAAEGEK
jgi:hypothetical protein